MNRENWERILKKYEKSFKQGKAVCVIVKAGEENVISGIIKEIDDNFLVIEEAGKERIKAIIALEQVVALKPL
ncbi:MAG: hypothetical protein HZA00_08570 [Nitrospinae bacterium]|nr:hypothetical protein [Nitrospinota bacterium]